MNVLVIPARWGSTRFPGKPLVEIAGVVMVERVYRRCLQARGFDAVVVATEDDRVAEYCLAHGIAYDMTSYSCRNGTERCHEVADKLKDTDLVVNVQGDEPLIDPVIPQRVLFNLQNKPERVWTAGRKIREGELESRDCVKARECNGNVWTFEREWKSYHNCVHVGVYGYSVKKLREYASMDTSVDEVKEGLEQLRWREPLACITVEYNGIGVDRPEDIKRVEDRLNGPAPVSD